MLTNNRQKHPTRIPRPT